MTNSALWDWQLVLTRDIVDSCRDTCSDHCRFIRVSDCITGGRFSPKQVLPYDVWSSLPSNYRAARSSRAALSSTGPSFPSCVNGPIHRKHFHFGLVSKLLQSVTANWCHSESSRQPVTDLYLSTRLAVLPFRVDSLAVSATCPIDLCHASGLWAFSFPSVYPLLSVYFFAPLTRLLSIHSYLHLRRTLFISGKGILWWCGRCLHTLTTCKILAKFPLGMALVCKFFDSNLHQGPMYTLF